MHCITIINIKTLIYTVIIVILMSHNLQELLSQVTEDYPTIILSDISPEDIKLIIEFIYHGEVRIPVDNINSLLEAAQSLKIGGLIDVSIKFTTSILLYSYSISLLY